jgi:hypothetical protein
VQAQVEVHRQGSGVKRRAQIGGGCRQSQP